MSHEIAPVRKRRVAATFVSALRRRRNMSKGPPMSRRAELLREIAALVAEAKDLHLADTAFLLGVAHLELQTKRYSSTRVMFRDATVMRPAEVAKFLASTRHIARLRPSESDEEYDVYVYPR